MSGATLSSRRNGAIRLTDFECEPAVQNVDTTIETTILFIAVLSFNHTLERKTIVRTTDTNQLHPYCPIQINPIIACPEQYSTLAVTGWLVLAS